MRSGSTSRPRYVPQVGQSRCGRFGSPQVGQTFGRRASIECCARRLSRRDLLDFCFVTAMSGPDYSRRAISPVGATASRKRRSCVTTTSAPS